MIDDLRYERKWVFDNVDPITLLSNLINSSLHFQEQYKQRTVNSNINNKNKHKNNKWTFQYKITTSHVRQCFTRCFQLLDRPNRLSARTHDRVEELEREGKVGN